MTLWRHYLLLFSIGIATAESGDLLVRARTLKAPKAGPRANATQDAEFVRINFLIL